jgi:hypothetical protein
MVMTTTKLGISFPFFFAIENLLSFSAELMDQESPSSPPFKKKIQAFDELNITFLYFVTPPRLIVNEKSVIKIKKVIHPSSYHQASEQLNRVNYSKLAVERRESHGKIRTIPLTLAVPEGTFSEKVLRVT